MFSSDTDLPRNKRACCLFATRPSLINNQNFSMRAVTAELKFEILHMFFWDWGILALKDVRK